MMSYADNYLLLQCNRIFHHPTVIIHYIFDMFD